MVNNLFSAFENICRRRDFYLGRNTKQIKFYQLGEGYLEKFATLSRQAKQGHLLLSPVSGDKLPSLLAVGARLLEENIEDGVALVEKGDYAQTLLVLGKLQHLCAAIINATDDGLYLAASLFNKHYSYDSYREFIACTDDFNTALDKIFQQGLEISEKLLLVAAQVSERGFAGTEFKHYDDYRCVMNRLYVVTNMIIYLLQQASIDAVQLATELHASHLSQCWSLESEQRNAYLVSQQYDLKNVVFYPLTQEKGYLCYDLHEGELLFPPHYHKPDITSLAEQFAARCAADRLEYNPSNSALKSKEQGSATERKWANKGIFYRQLFAGRK